MRVLSGLILLTLLVLILLFAVNNQTSVPVWLPGRTMSLPLALVAIGSYLLGMISGGSVIGMMRRSWHRINEPVD
jgi:uncharacterized integral membrane protein